MNAHTIGRGTPAVLVEAILDPRSLARLDAPGWERLLSCARRNAVLAYLAERAHSARIIDELQEQPRSALLAARIAATRWAQLARWELDRVRRVLLPARIPMVALKGVAYILRGMPHASTRLLSDIDVMVPATVSTTPSRHPQRRMEAQRSIPTISVITAPGRTRSRRWCTRAGSSKSTCTIRFAHR